ncbi:hypothetical protein [Allocoleopsis sp.]|uniref:hypothetical protein n=1 Tax=Allocoleopsis sp. TaxID=3088169 RepID=UPI002FD6C337
MFKTITLASVTMLIALTLGSLPLRAQTPSDPAPNEQTPSPQTPSPTESTTTTNRQQNAAVLLDLNRAKNLARQAAEKANGGLGNYRAELSMHGPASKSTYVDNGNGSWTFTFKGNRPGETIPSYESVVTVSTDGQVKIDYNGAVRTTSP